MKKLYCFMCSMIENPKVSYLLKKTLFLSIISSFLSTIYSKCKNEDEKLFKEVQSIKLLV